jgi:hypothetical protein
MSILSETLKFRIKNFKTAAFCLFLRPHPPITKSPRLYKPISLFIFQYLKQTSIWHLFLDFEKKISPKNVVSGSKFILQIFAKINRNIVFYEKRQYFRRKWAKIAENCEKFTLKYTLILHAIVVIKQCKL